MQMDLNETGKQTWNQQETEKRKRATQQKTDRATLSTLLDNFTARITF